MVTSPEKFDQRIAGNQICESSASITLNAPLSVEVNQLRDGDRLLPMPFLLDETALPRPVCQRLILEWAFTALVAGGTVQRVVYQKKLEDSILGLFNLFRFGDDLHALVYWEITGRLEREASRPLDLHQTHSAHTHLRQPVVKTEARNEDSCLLRRLDEEFSTLGLDLPTVDGNRYQILRNISGQKDTLLP